MARSESWKPLQAWVIYRVWVKPKWVHAQMPPYLYENVLIIKIIIMTLLEQTTGILHLIGVFLSSVEEIAGWRCAGEDQEAACL